MSEQKNITFVNALKAGAIVGLIGAGVNNIWSLIAQQLGSVPPVGFAIPVTVSSIFPVLIGAIIYFALVKFLKKGHTVFMVVSAVFILVSFYGPLQPVLPDGSPAPQGFALLTVPMHFISGGLAMWGIPKWSLPARRSGK
jgi:hypothetical protein